MKKYSGYYSNPDYVRVMERLAERGDPEQDFKNKYGYTEEVELYDEKEGEEMRKELKDMKKNWSGSLENIQKEYLKKRKELHEMEEAILSTEI